MARTKNRPAIAPSAAHAAPQPAPAHRTAPDPGSPAAAVHAALSANPGGTVAVIASAAGTGKPATRDALLDMEKAGTATRVKGSRPGVADTWTLTAPVPDDSGPAAGQDEQASQPSDAADGGPGGSGDGGPVQDAGEAAAEVSAAPDAGTGPAGPHDDATAGGDRADTAPDEPGDEAAPGGPQEADASDDPPAGDTPPGSTGEASGAPDPALIAQAGEGIAQIRAAADTAATALAGGADLRRVLAGLDEIYEQAVQARRSLKAAVGGKRTPAARPGGLRDKVLAHLDAHPEDAFTPHEIHKVLGNSSGAIANALDTLVKLGHAELASDKPRRFRRTAQPAAAAPGADSADSGQGEGTDVAGAA
ncbi:MAG TPA: hypothetical protein VGI96_01285 [Streptosporangiaceae bacterium]|jgi:hypothetical protein